MRIPFRAVGVGVIVLFFVDILSAFAGGPSVGVAVTREAAAAQVESPLPDTSVDPDSPRWTDTEISQFADAVTSEVGNTPGHYGYIHIVRTMLGVKITHAACYESRALGEMLTKIFRPGELLEVLPNVPVLPTLELVQQLATADQAGSESACAAYQTGTSGLVACPCTSKWQGTLFEYGGHSGNLWEMLPYLPAPLLPVVKYDWWQTLSGDVTQQAMYEHWAQIEDWLRTSNYCLNPAFYGHPPEVCAKATQHHHTDEYLQYVQGKYAEWGYDEESGQTYDQQHVTTSCGGIWLPFAAPWGCAIGTNMFRTIIFIGGTYSGSKGGPGKYNYGDKVVDVATDLVGRKSESFVMNTVMATKAARHAAMILTQNSKEGSTYTAAGWSSSYGGPDEASNTVTGPYDSGTLNGVGLYNVATHPVMNDRATFGLGSVEDYTSENYPIFPRSWLIVYGGAGTNTYGGGCNVGESRPTPCNGGSACAKALGAYIGRLAVQPPSGLVDAVLFARTLHEHWFWSNPPCSCAKDVWSKPRTEDSLWGDVDGESCAATTPERMITRFEYFHDNDKLPDLYLRLYMAQWGWPVIDDGKHTSSLIYHDYTGDGALFNRQCNYFGIQYFFIKGDPGYISAESSGASVGPGGIQLMWLRLPEFAQKIRDGTLNYGVLRDGDDNGKLGFNNRSCPVAKAAMPPDVAAQLLNLLGIGTYTDEGQTYRVFTIATLQQMAFVQTGGLAGLTQLYINDWLFLIPAFGLALIAFGPFRRHLRRRRF